MRRFAECCFGFLSIVVLLLGLAWVAGITPDGILNGQWDDAGDHPTNWYDATQHPGG